MANQRVGQGKKKSYRLRFNFWLDITKPEEEHIADKIEHLKNERSFTSVIRDGIRLVCDLKNGKLDVLFELFPWVRAEFLEYMREVTHEASPTTEQPEPSSQHEAEQERRIEEAKQAIEAERQAIAQERKRMEAEQERSQVAIQRQLARIEEFLLQQGNVPIRVPNGSGVGLRGLNTGGAGLKGGNLRSNFTAPPPVFDDDDDLPELNIQKVKSSNANITLINAMKSLSEQKQL